MMKQMMRSGGRVGTVTGLRLLNDQCYDWDGIRKEQKNLYHNLSSSLESLVSFEFILVFCTQISLEKIFFENVK
jgi:hypothetical protein